MGPVRPRSSAKRHFLIFLLPPPPTRPPANPFKTAGGVVIDGNSGLTESSNRTREKLRQQLREGKLDERMVEIDVRERNFPSFEIISNQGVEEMDVNLKYMLPNIFAHPTTKPNTNANNPFD